MEIKKSIICQITWLAAVILIPTGCGHQKKPNAPADAAPPIELKTVLPKRGEITRTISLPGNIYPNQQAALYSKVAGYLKTITVDKGDAVEKGKLLAEIEAPELLADAAKYKADLEVAELDYKRTLDAQKKAPDLVTLQSIDETKGKALAAKASLERAETLIGFCRIIAPFSGMITKRSFDPGAFVPAATSGNGANPLVTLMDFSVVRLQVTIPEAEVPRIQNGLPVRVSIEELPGPAIQASITRFSHALDETTKTMLTEIDIPNPKYELRPGMYAIGKIGIEKRTNALLIPIEALLVEKSGSSVFVPSENKAKKIPVKTGFNDGTVVEILEGLKEEQPVLLLEKRALNNGQPIKVVELK